MRIFAGPNGSGKTTIKNNFEFNLGYHLNADSILLQLQLNKSLNLTELGIQTSTDKLHKFIKKQGLYLRLLKESQTNINLKKQIKCLNEIIISENILIISELPNAYIAAILTDFIRFELLKNSHTFSFETVFSHPDKVNFIKKANDNGFRTYLYFVSTESVEINIERVRQRVAQNGHDVPIEKIKKRYILAMENLYPAIKLAYKSFIFDNSFKASKLFATVSPEKTITIMPGENIPIWFEHYVLSRFN